MPSAFCQGGAGVIDAGAAGGGAAGGGKGGAGVFVNGGTVVTSGIISGGAGGAGAAGIGAQGDAVGFGAGAATLVPEPGAVFAGGVHARADPSDTLALAGRRTGTLAGFGSAITGFATIQEDADAHWILTGPIAGGGALDIGADARLTLNGAVSIATIAFSAGAQLGLAAPLDLTSMLARFGAGDAVDLESLVANTLTYAGGTLTLLDGATHVDTLSFAGSYGVANFALKSDGHGGTDVLYVTAAGFWAGAHAPHRDATRRCRWSRPAGACNAALLCRQISAWWPCRQNAPSFVPWKTAGGSSAATGSQTACPGPAAASQATVVCPERDRRSGMGYRRHRSARLGPEIPVGGSWYISFHLAGCRS